jgi:hypothetical protein
MKRKAKRTQPARRPRGDSESQPGREARLAEAGQAGLSPVLSGGDVDADWRSAESAGDEAVGGTVATPDQDVVDQIGRAVGVVHEPTEEVRTSDEILQERDRRRWQLEWEAAERQEPR